MNTHRFQTPEKATGPPDGALRVRERNHGRRRAARKAKRPITGQPALMRRTESKMESRITRSKNGEPLERESAQVEPVPAR